MKRGPKPKKEAAKEPRFEKPPSIPRSMKRAMQEVRQYFEDNSGAPSILRGALPAAAANILEDNTQPGRLVFVRRTGWEELTVRDHFALTALSGLASTGSVSAAALPELAYRIADGMLRERDAVQSRPEAQKGPFVANPFL